MMTNDSQKNSDQPVLIDQALCAKPNRLGVRELWDRVPNLSRIFALGIKTADEFMI